MRQTAHTGENAACFDIVLLDEIFNGVEQVLLRFEAKGVSFHSEPLNKKYGDMFVAILMFTRT
jgi:hypothetical protein